MYVAYTTPGYKKLGGEYPPMDAEGDHPPNFEKTAKFDHHPIFGVRAYL